MANEETARGPVEPEADTTIVADDTTRGEAPAVAWSLDPDDTAPAADRRPLPRSLVLLLAGVCVAAIALAAFVLGGQMHPPQLVPPTHTPTAAPPPPAASSPSLPPPAPPTFAPPPEPAPSPPSTVLSDIDAKYLAYLHREGVPYRSGDADAIASAHEICSALETRPLVDETDSVRRALGWTRNDAATLVGAAVAYYCPQHVP